MGILNQMIRPSQEIHASGPIIARTSGAARAKHAVVTLKSRPGHCQPLYKGFSMWTRGSSPEECHGHWTFLQWGLYLGNREDGKACGPMQNGGWDGLLRTQAAHSCPAAHDVGGFVDVGGQGCAEGVVHPGAQHARIGHIMHCRPHSLADCACMHFHYCVRPHLLDVWAHL